MVNSHNKTLAAKSGAGSAPVSAGVSVPVLQAGNGNNLGGNTGSGGASASPAPIPGAGTKAKRGLRSELTVVVNALGTQLPGDSIVTVGGVQVTVQDLIGQVVPILALFASLDAAVLAQKNQRQALATATPGARQLLANIKAAIVAFFGKGNPALVAFGFSGTKRRQLTAEQLLARAEKVKQTRLQRGTLGPRKKQSVKFQGQVQVQTSVSGTPTSGGIPSSAGAPTRTASSNPSTAGAPAGASTTPVQGASPGPGSSTPGA